MADWKIIDGNLPFLDEFPQMYSIDDAPLSTWRIRNGNLPYKLLFPTMPSIDDAPLSIWKIIDGDLPFKSLFPKMYKITTGTRLYFGNKRIIRIYHGDIVIKSVYKQDTKIF